MTDVRQFIKNLGPNAPTFFDTTEKTIQRWVKTGNVPIKQAQKIFMAMQAMQAPPQTNPEPPVVVADPIDPMTHLPTNLEKIQPNSQGRPPEWIDLDPREQSFGNNFTRPSRPPTRSLQPMKLRDEGGSKVAYVENTPALADMKNPDGTPKAPALPPSIGGTDWAAQGAPLPAPLQKPNPNDPRPAQRETTPVPQK